MNDIIICAAELNDAAEILAIYSHYVENTAVTFEYSTPSLEEFILRMDNTLKKYPYLVAKADGRIVGYAYTGAFKGRAAYDWAVETSIYIKKDERRQGIGKKLYTELEEISKAQNILNMNACIACPEKEDEYLSADSIKFHEKMGYRFVGKFEKCGYKFGRWYDMVWMEKLLGAHEHNPKAIIPFGEVIKARFLTGK